jgi:UDP-GlcNAc:undecaprenyl-phosphate/decaprenyl-phosphate GlcNAc-1-phosphate transferase
MTFLLEKYSIFFILPALTFFLSLIFTKASIPILCKLNLIAHNGERHIHKKPIPTMGGITFIGSFSIVMFLAYFSPWKSYLGIELIKTEFIKIFIPLLILIPTGIIDDKICLRARYKLLLQVLTGALGWWCGARIDIIFGYEIPEFIGFILTIFWTVSFINAFNFIDGMDGLAAGISIIAAISLSVVFFLNGNLLYALLLLCLAASCLGFLRYNFYPAKIFMGDTGSMFLGYMFAVIGILSSNKSASFSAISISILACGIPLIDTFLAVWRRITSKLLHGREQGKGVMCPDKEHLHHRFFARNKSQASTTILVYRIALFMGIVSVCISVFEDSIPGIALVLLLLTFSVIIQKVAVIEMWNSTRLIFRGLKKPRKSVLLNMLHPLWDLFIVVLTIVLAIYLSGSIEIFHKDILLLYIAPIIFSLFLSRNYKIFWFRPDIGDYFNLFKVLSIAYILTSALSYGYVKHFYPKEINMAFKHCLIAYVFACAGILGERFLLRWIQTALVKLFNESHLNGDSVPILLLGGGIHTCLFIRRQNSFGHSKPFRIQGIVDDDPALKGLYIYGYKVLGGVRDLNEIYKRTPFEKVIITNELIKKGPKRRLMNFCESHNVEVMNFIAELNSESK